MSIIPKGNLSLQSGGVAPAPGSEPKQRRRMLIALVVLLGALAVVLIRDRQLPPSGYAPEADSSEETPQPTTASSVTPQPAVGASSSTKLTQTTPPKKAENKKATASAGPPPTDLHAGASPLITAMDRAVLPPLEIEVVAGNQHRSLSPANNAVKIEIQPDSPGASSATGAGQPQDSGARVSVSPDTAARVTHPVEPGYPLLAKQMQVQGAVVLQALIDKTGHIQDLRVVSGPSILAAAAREAVKQWHFKPYLQKGQPVETEARITVNFTISTY